MNINIPPDSQQWLFQNHDRSEGSGAIWSFRWPPPCEIGDTLNFRFEGEIVATAIVDDIIPPGVCDGFAHHGKRYLQGHKVVWMWETFRDVREKALFSGSSRQEKPCEYP